MADFATWPDLPDGGGVSLKAAGLVASSTAGTSYELGKGRYEIIINVSAIEVASGDEGYTIDIEANTRNDTSTYYRIGSMTLGATAVTGRASADSADEFVLLVENPLDYQVRVNTRVVGSVATGINYTADAYPLPRKA